MTENKTMTASLTAGGSELESPETDVIKSLIVKDHALISILNQLMNGQRRIVWLHDSVGHLG